MYGCVQLHLRSSPMTLVPSPFFWRNKMEIKEKLKEAQLWYKRKLAMREDVEIEDINEEDVEQVEMLTEIPKNAEILTENK